MGLFTPAWKSKDVKKAMSAVETCRDGKTLARIAREAPASNVRRAAAEKLTDQSVLCQLAREDPVADVRQAAVERLTDQNVLEQVARTDGYFRVRLEAARRLNRQEALIAVAQTDESSFVRQAALDRIDDERTRLELSLADREARPKDRLRALELFAPDEATLERLIFNGYSCDFTEAALARLNDPDALERVARDEPVRSVYETAIDRLSQRENLLRLISGEKTAKKTIRRMRELGLLDEEALSLAHPSAAKEAQLERDRAALFSAAAAAERGAELLRAYGDQDVDALRAIATPEAVEALLLLLREYGEEVWGGPTKLARSIHVALQILWKEHGDALRPAIEKAEQWSIRTHRDNGASDRSCHLDEGPLTFDMSRFA